MWTNGPRRGWNGKWFAERYASGCRVATTYDETDDGWRSITRYATVGGASIYMMVTTSDGDADADRLAAVLDRAARKLQRKPRSTAEAMNRR